MARGSPFASRGAADAIPYLWHSVGARRGGGTRSGPGPRPGTSAHGGERRAGAGNRSGRGRRGGSSRRAADLRLWNCEARLDLRDRIDQQDVYRPPARADGCGREGGLGRTIAQSVAPRNRCQARRAGNHPTRSGDASFRSAAVARQPQARRSSESLRQLWRGGSLCRPVEARSGQNTQCFLRVQQLRLQPAGASAGKSRRDLLSGFAEAADHRPVRIAGYGCRAFRRTAEPVPTGLQPFC